MNFIKTLFVLHLGFNLVFSLNNGVQLAIDVIRSYERSTAVFGVLCWSQTNKLILAKEAMRTNRGKKVQYGKHILRAEKSNDDKMIILMDLNCPNRGKVLEEANKNHKFEKPYRWLWLSTKDDWDEILKSIEKLHIFIDSDVTIACNVKSNETFLRKVYRIDADHELITEMFATWSFANGLNIEAKAKETAVLRRKNFKGKSIGISTVATENTKESDLLTLKDRVKDNLSKSTYHNVLPLFSFLNASKVILFAETWGYNINNSWNGMIGQIVRGGADLCGTVTFMTENRLDVISYLTQPIRITAKFFFREPPLSLQNNLFYLPFRTTVWMCSGALMVLLFIVILANAKWEAVKYGKSEETDPNILKPDVSDVAILVAGAVVQQSGGGRLQGCRGRLVIFILFLTCLFLYTAYAANIVALLQSSSDQIRTLSDLLHSKLELGVEDQPYTRHYFMTATDPVRKAIYDNKIARVGYKPNFMPVEEGFKKLQNLDLPFAFYTNTGIGYRLIQDRFEEHEKCGLQEIEYLQSSCPWLCCSKRSPNKELYKIGLVRISEHGISDRMNRLIYTRKPTCSSRSGSFGSVNMTDFQPVLLCLLYGMITSSILLVAEIWYFKRQKRLQEKGKKADRQGSELSIEYNLEDEDY